MFSVPGWNLSAQLKTQVEDPAAKKSAAEGKKSKKRKREKKGTEDVNEENVGEIFDRIVAQKEDAPRANGNTDITSEVQNAPGAEEAPAKKKRKRGKKKPKTKDGEDEDTEKKGSSASIGNVPKSKGTKANSEPVSDRQQKKSNEDQKPHGHENSTKKSKKDTPKAIEPPTSLASTLSLLPEPKGLTPLQRSMRVKLASARFRHLNESLYTKPSAESLSIFKESPEMFEEYHRGFQQQVEVWPENPVDVYVQAIISRGKVRLRDARKDKKRNDKKGKNGEEEQQDSTTAALKPLPRNMKGHATVADLGCGTAALAYTLQPHLKHLNLTIHSFDLSQPSGPSGPLVTVADISALPLPDSSVDVAVFCLALMGTNWLDFVDEAYRILRWKGELWVAEIKSRFGRVTRKGKPPINSIGSLRKDAAPKKKLTKKGREKEEPEGPQNSEDEEELATHVDGVEVTKNETDVSAFVEVMRKRGFVLDQEEKMSVDMRNKMFVRMQFVKAAAPVKGKNAKKVDGDGPPRGAGKGKKFIELDEEDQGDEKDAATLKPCLYKVR